jgi:chemotaxis signal transduction protein
MDNRKLDKNRVILVRNLGKKLLDKNPALLFPSTQIDEFIHAINIHPVPFSPDFLLGVSVWNKQILPVVDAFSRYGIRKSQSSLINDSEHYVVVKMVNKIKGEKQLSRGVLKIPRQIMTIKIPDSSSAVDIEAYNLDKSIIKGTYEYEDDLIIVPDLASVFNSL